jgi:peptidoglycan/xylan/chitin deacetylase (PgdA/CDA1 family)
MMRSVKTLLGYLCFHTGLYRLFVRNRAVITLFHRVDDRYGGNPISCTRAEFESYCRFFRRFFHVVTLEELLARLAAGRPVDRLLVITFDDGYLDNRAFAAGALRQLGLPACFFIATDFIGSRRIPWWDEEAGITSEWMSWPQVRELRDLGFEVGAHTMNHVDLGVVPREEAEREILGSRTRLERELGQPVTFFTYPYGRRHQITESHRDIVRGAFACCLSAFGSSVRSGEDPYVLKRTPISPWHKSPYQFGFEAMVGAD